jgi:hypothetical protein
LSSILAASDLMSMMFEPPSLFGVMDPMVAKEARKSTQ